MSTFETKKVWHSKLKYSSPLVVKFGTGQIVASEYNDEDIIYFNVRGDDKDYYYRIENAEIREYLDGVDIKGQWVSITATGKAEDASIGIEFLDGAALAAMPVATHQPSTGTAHSREQSRSPGEFNTGSQEGNMEACLVAAKGIFMRTFVSDAGSLNTEEGDIGVIERLAVTMFIQSNMDNFRLPISENAAAVIDESREAAAADVSDTSVNLTGLKELAAGLPLHTGTSHDGKQLKRALDKIASTESMDQDGFDAAMAWVLDEANHQAPGDDDEEDLPF